MLSFAARTGLGSGAPARRYLWTDAFAVTNFLGLARATGERHYEELALSLIGQVHRVLGRHRGDDGRSGWISGLGEAEGEAHPTRGGLRIGKRLREREAGEPFDELAEWDRDGQYFHYLTKWMHALDQAARSTERPLFNLWARELADAAHRAFAHGKPGSARRMVWKMSIDLARPLVASMGQHDPLDGLITAAQLDATARSFPGVAQGPRMRDAALDYAAMIEGGHWSTTDPLGLGGLLVDAARVAQLTERTPLLRPDLVDELLDAAHAGLSHYLKRSELGLPAGYRLAFRELGLAIGVRAVEHAGLAGPFQPLMKLAPAIEAFWLDERHQRSESWLEHQDINEVMLATSLAPEGFVLLGPCAEQQRAPAPTAPSTAR
jgi:hypothetical protein